MELKQIKELIAAMEKAGLKKMSIKEKDGFEIHLEKPDGVYPQPVAYPSVLHHPPAPIPHKEIHHSVEKHAPHAAEAHAESKQQPGKFVTAPIVGTFYSAPSPEDPPFVKVGDRVDENTVICIIEAMKVMNEVKAGISGTIAEIYVESGHPVEFGTKMFRIV